MLTESGYRCAVPTCRTILALDLHHMVEVSEGGGNEASNLLPLCPTCHALFHRGEIQRESIYVWKSVLVSLTRAFDHDTLDLLLFLACREVIVSLDGVLRFARLIANGLADSEILQGPWGPAQRVSLTARGAQLVAAWSSGRREEVAEALAPPAAEGDGA